MDRLNGIINMTGLLSLVCMLVVTAIFWRKKSKLMHRLHKPLTIIGGVFTLVHTVISLVAVSMMDINVLLVILSGILAVAGFAASIVVLVNKKTERVTAVRKHVIYSFISVGISILHVVLAEVLL
ncbi:MAG: hypothetical protein Q4G60_10265 [bacterium]|nr:hypothetical protein [bacterium]